MAEHGAARPLLVYVSGKPGAGKSTLARALAERSVLGLPVLSTDAVRAGLEEAGRFGEPSNDRPTGLAVVEAFYGLVDAYLAARVSLIVELSFRRGLDEPRLRRLLARARVRNVHCDVATSLAQQRFVARDRTLHGGGPSAYQTILDAMQDGVFDWSEFDPLDLDVPRLWVDTTDGCAPGLAHIAAFCRELG